jgi:hypothetical protein
VEETADEVGGSAQMMMPAVMSEGFQQALYAYNDFMLTNVFREVYNYLAGIIYNFTAYADVFSYNDGRGIERGLKNNLSWRHVRERANPGIIYGSRYKRRTKWSAA